jgi:hypothetical protein
MADDIRLGIGVDPGGLAAGLSGAVSAIRVAADRMKSSMTGVQDKVGEVTNGMRRFEGVIGGLSLAAFAASSRTSITAIDDLNDASDKTGASVEELSSLVNTLAPFGTGLDQITTATGRLVKAMTNADDETSGAGEAFDKLGIKTRDAAGNLRPTQAVLQEVAVALDRHKDSTNKSALAVAIFGKAGTELLPMLKDLASAEKQAATITTEQAAAAEKAAQQINRLGREMQIMREETANALIPALNDLLGKLRSIAAISTNPMKWGKYLFGDAADIDKEVARIESDIKRLQGVVAGGSNNAGGRNTENLAAGQGLLGQWLGDTNSARDALMQLQRDLQEAKAVQAAQQKLGVSGVRQPQPAFSDARFGAGKTDAPSLRRAPDPAAAALANRQRSALEQMDQQLAKEAQLTEAEQMRLRITTGAYKDFSESVKVRLMQAAEEIDRINAVEAAHKAATDAETEDIKALAELRKQATAEIARQNEEIARTADRYKELADPTFKYTKQLEEIRKLVELGPARGGLSQDQGMSAEFAVQNQMQDALDGGAKAKEPAWIGTLEGGFNRLFQSIKDGSVTAGGVMQGAFAMASDAVTGALSKLAAEWIANLVIGKVTAVQAAFADISASAARAGAAAFASTAAIPIVGPGLAPAAGAAAYAGAMSFTSGLAAASAAGGFDIPAGVNPMTQLHAREMVLPEKHADVIRSIADGGGGSGLPPIHVHGTDPRSIKRMLIDNTDALAEALRSLQKKGVR